MRSVILGIMIIGVVIIALSCEQTQKSSKTQLAAVELTAKQQLGKKLFNDTNLSTPPGQACADCHAPQAGFAEPKTENPTSQGIHPDRFGNRNDLPAAYAGFSPEFRYDKEKKEYIGGTFWDGRAANLVEQAKGPFLNQLEMANPDKKAVVDQVSKAEYVNLFKEIYGADALQDVEKAYNFIADAIADYEKSKELNRFDSKFDLYLAGKAALTEQEKSGLALYEDKDKGNCATCHTSKPGPNGVPPVFSDYTYKNLGVPKNAENSFYYLSGDFNPAGVSYVDLGLGAIVKKPEENGKFRVPSLRNVEVTGPYMHNGVFKTLHQVVSFYNTRDIGPWDEPEVPQNVNKKDMGTLGLTEQEIDDIVAFLKTLTDGYSEKE